MPIESRRGKDWTRDELIFALGLYFQIPFSKICKTNKEVVRLSQFLGRSPASLSMKMDNLARFDPTLQAKNMVGLSNGSKMDEQIWREFENAPESVGSRVPRDRVRTIAPARPRANGRPNEVGRARRARRPLVCTKCWTRGLVVHVEMERV